jgi:CubicO group peptidase (beta-lactamase class C family)
MEGPSKFGRPFTLGLCVWGAVCDITSTRMTTTIDISRLSHAAGVAEEAVRSGTYPTAVLAVANSRDTLWEYVVPGADGAALNSIFLLASITKPVVATAIMRLVQEGKLLLNRPVADYLPEFAQNGKEQVTTWHILNHSSGMDEGEMWAELTGMDPQPSSFEWLWDAACRSRLNWEPGSAYLYNSLSFSVLGQLITVLGGAPYPEFMHRHIFRPLGMSSTAFRPADTERAVHVHFTPESGVSDAYREPFLAREDPAGGLWGTSADIIRFAQANLRGGTLDGYSLLSPASVALVTRHLTEGQTQFEHGRVSPFNYGLGWGKPASPPDGGALTSPRAFGHTGASGTMLWIDPEYDLIFVYLSNLWGAEGGPRDRALNAVYGALRVE